MNNAEILEVQQGAVTYTTSRGYEEASTTVEHDGSIDNCEYVHERKNALDASGDIDQCRHEKYIENELYISKKNVFIDDV